MEQNRSTSSMKSVFYFLLLSILLGSATTPKHKSLIPPGYDLVPGTDNIPAFLIGQNPVCNFEYSLYNEWLTHTFVDFPEISKAAIPQASTHNIFPQNDPLVNAYFGHPAYADYPVVGVNWHQAMEYCSWKTDRINESICVDLAGIKYPDYLKNCVNENNFNTEAYLNGQFYISQPPIKNHTFFHYKYNKKQHKYEKPNESIELLTINSSHEYPAFLYGGRLPTEEEWNYYMANKPVNNIHFFAEKSYLELAKYYNMPSDFTAAYGKNRTAGINNNLHEWMLDTFSQAILKHQNHQEMYENSGLQLTKNHYFLDQFGSLREKDSMGRFGFRIMGWKPTGEAILIHRHHYPLFDVKMVKIQDFSQGLKDSITSIYTNNHIDSFRNLTNGYVYNYVQLQDCIIAGYNVVFYISKKPYQVTLPIPYSNKENDLAHVTNPENYTFVESTCIWGCNPNFKLAHVTKNLKTRTSRIEDKGYTDVGFRVVFPYYGNALPEPIAW